MNTTGSTFFTHSVVGRENGQISISDNDNVDLC